MACVSSSNKPLSPSPQPLFSFPIQFAPIPALQAASFRAKPANGAPSSGITNIGCGYRSTPYLMVGPARTSARSPVPYRHTAHRRAEITEHIHAFHASVVRYALQVMRGSSAAKAVRHRLVAVLADDIQRPFIDIRCTKTLLLPMPQRGWVSISLPLRHRAGLLLYAGLNVPSQIPLWLPRLRVIIRRHLQNTPAKMMLLLRLTCWLPPVKRPESPVPPHTSAAFPQQLPPTMRTSTRKAFAPQLAREKPSAPTRAPGY